MEEEVGDRIDDGLTMDQPEEVEVGRRASSLRERDLMATDHHLWQYCGR